MYKKKNLVSSSKKRLNKTGVATAVAISCSAALGLFGNAAHAQEAYKLFNDRLEIGLGAAQHFQAIEADDGAFVLDDENADAGFGRLRFNLELKFNITDHIFAFVDIAEEPNDFRGLDPFSLNQDFGFIDLNLTGLAGSTSNSEVHLKVGNIGVGTFDGLHSFSDGSVVQGNPLIGNSPASFGTAQSGIQITGATKPGGAVKSLAGDFAVTIPSFGGENSPDRGFNILTGVGIDFSGGLSFSTRFFIGEGGDQLDDEISPGVFSLAGVQQDGLFFGDGDNYILPSIDGAGERSSRIFHNGVVPGLDAFIWQLNAQYQSPSKNSLLRVWGGVAESDFSFVDAAGNQTVNENPDTVGVTEQESSITFLGIGGQQYLIPNKLYVAARYTMVDNDSDDFDGDTLERIQIGGGVFLSKRTLFKIEFVDQDEPDGSPGQVGGGFSGFVSELSVRF